MIFFKGKNISVANRCMYISLVAAGCVMLLLCAYYTFQVIWNGLWDNTPFRTVQVLLAIGGLGSLGIARVIKNQEILMHMVYERGQNGENAGLIDKKRASGDAAGK